MRTIKVLTMVAIVFGMNINADAKGWSKLKFWKKKDICCVDDCVTTGDCVDSCIDECGVKPDRWKTRLSCMGREVFSAPKHWLSDVCNQGCCQVDVHSSCVDNCVPESCCVDHCIDCCSTSNEHRMLAQLIYVSQTACKARDRKAAIHKIGNRFKCKCYPEIMCALAYALKDCDKHVRAEAADEIGDQLRKNGCCCSPGLEHSLRCALNDESRYVRREAAQALRLCGFKVSRKLDWIRSKNCEQGCIDGCCDSCIGDCCNSTACGQPDQWEAAPVSIKEAPKKFKVAPNSDAKNPVKIPQLNLKKPAPTPQDPKVKPAPKATQEKPVKVPYIPKEGETSFIMPSQTLQKLIDYKG